MTTPDLERCRAGHVCCPDDEPHDHIGPPPEMCPACAALLNPKPLTAGQALEARARRIAEMKQHPRRER